MNCIEDNTEDAKELDMKESSDLAASNEMPTEASTEEMMTASSVAADTSQIAEDKENEESTSDMPGSAPSSDFVEAAQNDGAAEAKESSEVQMKDGDEKNDDESKPVTQPTAGCREGKFAAMAARKRDHEGNLKEKDCVLNPNTPRHPHQLKLKPIPVASGQQTELTEAQRKERQRIIQLHMQLLRHAATCSSPTCQSANCTKMKGYLKHGAQCQVKATGDCHVCKRIRALLQLHARQCKADACPVPNCMAIRERLRYFKTWNNHLRAEKESWLDQFLGQDAPSQELLFLALERAKKVDTERFFKAPNILFHLIKEIPALIAQALGDGLYTSRHA